MKILKVLLLIVLGFAVFYFLGPKVSKPNVDSLPEPPFNSFNEVENYVHAINIHPLKVRKGCDAEVVWYNNTKQKTQYSLVYLHGFSACKEEGNPLHYQLAKKYGMNMFLPRLYAHGITGYETFNEMNLDSLIYSAKKAIAIGKTIGEKVIVIGTSTGGTLSMYLTPQDDRVAGQILLSPNLKIYDENAHLLDDQWGVQIGELVSGGEYIADEKVSDYKKKYWSTRIKVKTAALLEAMISSTINDDLYMNTKKPLFVAYYYKNEKESDYVISTNEIKKMFNLISTPIQNKTSLQLVNANNHVISNPTRSNPESVRFLEKNIQKWVEATFNIMPK